MERPTASSAFCSVGVRDGIRSRKPKLPSVPVSGRMTLAGWKESSDEWTLEHDWALLDQVPKFTVGGEEGGVASSNQRTFWAQLSVATPLLSSRNEMELFQRCQELDESPCAGPSPPLLQHWSVSSEGRVTGQTEDGRTIWLQSHVIGRLAGDPLADSSSLGPGGVCSMLPGGYVEAVGGRVYELGQPRRGQPSYPPSTRQTGWHKNDNDDSQESSVDDYSRSKSGLGWWMPATSATVAAILVYSVLSACIGYGAGLSISADQGLHQHSAMTSRTVTPTSSIVYVLPSKSSSATRRIMPPTEQQTQLSVSEQRAKLEARVLREQRMVQTIHKSLESDQINLQGLRQQEQQQQQQQLDPNRLRP
jgi:hypothetical protein